MLNKRNNAKDKQSAQTGMFADKWTREAIESIAIAIVLAFLFRAFEAEAFVIPTGSMAKTLCGRHKDVWCPECGYRYQAGASEGKDRGAWVSKDDQGRLTRSYNIVTATVCPMCRFPQPLDIEYDQQGFPVGISNPDHASFTGDRILVNKFAYLLAEPKRWDIIVFKYPGDTKQNYIKRLIGLPNEVLQIEGGDIFTYDNSENDYASGAPFQIARKDPGKLWSMLQVVHDTDFTPRSLIEAGWPTRWQDAAENGDSWIEENKEGDSEIQRNKRFHCEGNLEGDQWLRYYHIVPDLVDWEMIEDGEGDQIEFPPPRLVDDFYAYNAHAISTGSMNAVNKSLTIQREPLTADMGLHWVGDLAIEAEVKVDSNKGELMLELVEGGRKYTCRIDIANGTARLLIDQGEGEFDNAEEGESITELIGPTHLKGPGTYNVRFANCDDALTLWVDEKLVEWNHEAIYTSPKPIEPKYVDAQNPLDLAPARIGSQGAKITLERIKLLRDIYYLAINERNRRPGHDYNYDKDHANPRMIRAILADPEQWGHGGLFSYRRSVEFNIKEDEFMPMGDNSPQSSDGRVWGRPRNGFAPEGSGITYNHGNNVVPRHLLTGKAFVVFWPHAWALPGPFPLKIVPNFQGFGRVR